MKAAYFCTARYLGQAPQGVWPTPVQSYSSEVAQHSMRSALEQLRMADELGFDLVSVAEHHYSPFSLTPNPMVLAGALTQVVKKARIALLGPIVPLLNPVRVAEEFAMLDTLTGGRLVAGMMRGTPNEYVTYGINPGESRDRFEEALQLIRRAWTEPHPFGWQGRYYQYRAVSIWPRPVQQPHPPIYMSGSSPESGEFAAHNHLGLGLAVTTVPHARKAIAHYRAHALREGWEPSEDDVIYRLGVYVADSDEEAMADISSAPRPAVRITQANRAVEAAALGSGYYGRDVAGQLDRRGPRELKEQVQLGQMLLGSPDTVFAQIRHIKQELGAGILDLAMAGAGEKKLHSIELFGTKVLPRMREL